MKKLPSDKVKQKYSFIALYCFFTMVIAVSSNNVSHFIFFNKGIFVYCVQKDMIDHIMMMQDYIF